MLEAMQTHAPVARAQALQRCVQALEMVGIPAAASRLRSYPHEFSAACASAWPLPLPCSTSPR